MSDFRIALRREELVRIRAKLWCDRVSLQATLGKKLEARLRTSIRTSKYWKDDELLYGVVTRAARRAGLDPRLKDVGAHLDGSRVEGYANPVPLIFQERAVDSVIAKWKSKRGRIKWTTRSS